MMFAELIIFGLFDSVPGAVFVTVADLTKAADRTRQFAIVNAAISLGFIRAAACAILNRIGHFVKANRDR